MIFDMSKQLAAVKKAIEAGDEMGAAMELAAIHSAGMAMERRRCLDIVARKALNAAAVREEINRPVR